MQENQRRKKVWICSLSLSLLLFSPPTSCKVSAQDLFRNDHIPPERLIQDLKGFFKDIKAEIISIDGDHLLIGAGLKDGMKEYMRFDIVTTKKIRHPVTEEEVFTGEIKTGSVEIVKVEGNFSEGRLIEGTAQPGSRILLSNSPYKVYLQEEKGVDYFIVDDYIRELKKTERFEIVKDKDLSDIVIILSIKGERPQLLTQKALWYQTGKVFFESEVELQRNYIEKLKTEKALYEEELKDSDLLLSFRLPSSVRFINIADVDGDSREELIIAKDGYIEVYSLGVTLKGLYEIKIRGEPLGLYSGDINGDGKVEIVSSILEEDGAISQIYEFRDGEFSSIYKGRGLIRYLSGRLFIQDYSPDDGPTGEIKELKVLSQPEKSNDLLSPVLHLKEGYDIFSFVFLCNETPSASALCMTLSYDDRGYLYLRDEGGRVLWRSERDTGGFFSTFKKRARSPLLREEEWALKDRLIVEDERIYLIRRTPISGIAKGIGWSSSEIVSIRWNGREMIEEKIKEVGGAIVDFYLTKDRLYILQKPFMGISLVSLLKGENPKQTRLYIFKR